MVDMTFREGCNCSSGFSNLVLFEDQYNRIELQVDIYLTGDAVVMQSLIDPCGEIPTRTVDGRKWWKSNKARYDKNRRPIEGDA